MYIPGRLRTAESPSRTWMELASYAATAEVFSTMKGGAADDVDVPSEARIISVRTGEKTPFENDRSGAAWDRSNPTLNADRNGPEMVAPPRPYRSGSGPRARG